MNRSVLRANLMKTRLISTNYTTRGSMMTKCDKLDEDKFDEVEVNMGDGKLDEHNMYEAKLVNVKHYDKR